MTCVSFGHVVTESQPMTCHQSAPATFDCTLMRQVRLQDLLDRWFRPIVLDHVCGDDDVLRQVEGWSVRSGLRGRAEQGGHWGLTGDGRGTANV